MTNLKNKEAVQSVKLTQESKELFKQLCEENYTTPSAEIRRFVCERIKEFQNLNNKEE